MVEDTKAIAWGKQLSAEYHRPESGIDEEESVAYLGLSYWDLVQRHGEAQAANLFQHNMGGRLSYRCR